MPLNYETGGDTSRGGNFLSEPGTYHLMVVDATETPLKKDNTLIANAMFGVSLEVLDGTAPGQVAKQTSLTFFHGKQGEEKSIAFAKKKADMFFIATGLLTPQQVESKASVTIDVRQAVGRQIIAKFEKEKAEDRYVNLSFADIYHVDDPAVAAVPKNKAALAAINPKFRWPGGKPLGADAAPASGISQAVAAAASLVSQSATAYDDV